MLYYTLSNVKHRLNLLTRPIWEPCGRGLIFRWAKPLDCKRDGMFLKLQIVLCLLCRLCFQIGPAENKAFKAISGAVLRVPYPGDLKQAVKHTSRIIVPISLSTHFAFCFPGDSVDVAPPALSRLLPDEFIFHQYHGGQTTPPCHQTVTWIVFEKPIFISREQVKTQKYAPISSSR